NGAGARGMRFAVSSSSALDTLRRQGGLAFEGWAFARMRSAEVGTEARAVPVLELGPPCSQSNRTTQRISSIDGSDQPYCINSFSAATALASLTAGPFTELWVGFWAALLRFPSSASLTRTVCRWDSSWVGSLTTLARC